MVPQKSTQGRQRRECDLRRRWFVKKSAPHPRGVS
jgi:hypothetical protein